MWGRISWSSLVDVGIGREDDGFDEEPGELEEKKEDIVRVG